MVIDKILGRWQRQMEVEDLNENEKKFLLSLVEDGSKTDTEIAAEQDMSKSTANRIRRKFEENGVIQEYLPIIRLGSVGIRIFATISMELKDDIDVQEIIDMPNVIFMGETDNFKQRFIIFAGFSTFEDYNYFIEEFKDRYRDKVSAFENYLIAPDNILKEDFTHLIKHRLKESLKTDDR